MKRINFILIIIPFFFILISCVSVKKNIYLQGDLAKRLREVDNAYNISTTNYLLKPFDNLYIRVTSLDARSSEFLNNQAGFTSLPESSMASSLLGYRIDKEGAIEFPFVGRINVSGLTLDQVRDKIQQAVSKFVDQSNVTIKLLNDNITVIGEVNGPGRFLMYDEQLNIFEAISLAGDMTNYANRKKVRIIRRVGNDPQMIVLDTTDDHLLFSQFYYLKPGDIVYVEPRRAKTWELSATTLGLGLTFLNTSMVVTALILSMQDSNTAN